MLRIGVLASHEGTTLQSIIDACAQERISGRVVTVISNNRGSGALRRAAASIQTRARFSKERSYGSRHAHVYEHHGTRSGVPRRLPFANVQNQDA